jgi:hypothetical protein
MGLSAFWRRLPGYVAVGLLAAATALWTFWGFGEMYYEGWWGAWTNRLPYLVAPAACTLFTVGALTWPRVGGWLLFLISGAGTAWRWTRQASLGLLTLSWVVGWFPISAALVIAGLLLVLEGQHHRRRRTEGWIPPTGWLRRNLRDVVALGPSLVTAIGVTALFGRLLLTRFDDGDRRARLIEGNSVALVWAPEGPGWNWHPLRGVGRYPSWDDIALYGVPPVGIHPDLKLPEGGHANQADMQANGLCRHLSADGTTLVDQPQGIWRMPTADETVRSLVRGGASAGCTWDGRSTSANCQGQPNKDAPLWAPDEAPIYYWAADEYGAEEAWYVPYTGGGLYGGMIDHQPKNWGNARHGFRCVRD